MSHFAAFLHKNRILQPPSLEEQMILGGKSVPNPLHPYFPTDILLDGYVANELSVPAVLAIFSAATTAVLVTAALVVRQSRPSISAADLFTTLWFILCGGLHIIFEGYFVLNFRSMASLQSILGQLWKEYALSDSRYLTQSSFVVCVESVTVSVFGPLSLLTAGLIVTESPYRHPLQAIVSLGHVYSDVLYYATSTYDLYFLGKQHSRPEAVYFWGYYVFMNAFWIVIPLILLSNSVRASAAAFRALHRSEDALRKSGFAKKTR